MKKSVKIYIKTFYTWDKYIYHFWKWIKILKTKFKLTCLKVKRILKQVIQNK